MKNLLKTSWIKKIAIAILQIALGLLGGAGYQAATDGTSSPSSQESTSHCTYSHDTAMTDFTHDDYN